MSWTSTPSEIPGLQVLASGSHGNCLILGGYMALDMGVSYRTVAPYAGDLRAVFISHRHRDHLLPSTVRRLATEHPGILWMAGAWLRPNLLACGVLPGRLALLTDDPTPGAFGPARRYGPITIQAVSLAHDVPNIGCRLRLPELGRIFYATDTGTLAGITARNYDLYLVEANYRDADLRARWARKASAGLYAYEARVVATHMEHAETLSWLSEQMGPQSKYVLLHMHEEDDNATQT